MATENSATTPTAVEPTLDQLKAQIAECIASGDDVKLGDLIKEFNKRKSEIVKAQSEQIRKEQEELAKIRETVATEIHKTIRGNAQIAKLLTDTRATGFSYKLDTEDMKYRSVELHVATVKKPRTGTSNAGISSKDRYGIGLGEIFDKFATNEEKAEVKKLFTDAGDDKAKKKSANTKSWQIKDKVRVRAEKEGLITPTK